MDERPLPRGVQPFRLSDLTDASSLERAMNGAAIVVHLAGRVHIMREKNPNGLAAFRATNVAGTRMVCAAARIADVRRLVYISSIKVNGDGSVRPYVETDEVDPKDAYAISKVEAEAVVRDIGDANPRWTIFRPPLVYGEGVAGNFKRLIQVADLSLRIPLPLGSISNRRSMMYVGNLVDVIIHSFDRASAEGRTFLVADDEAFSTPDIIRCLAVHLGGESRLFQFPVPVLKSALILARRASMVQRLLESLTVDSSAVRTALGWTPPFSIEEGLRRTAGSWKGHVS